MIYDYEKLKSQPPVQFNLKNPWGNLSGDPNVQASGGIAGGAQEASQFLIPQAASGALNAVIPGLGLAIPAASAASKAAYSANNVGGDIVGSLFGYAANPLGGLMQGVDIASSGVLPSGEKIDTPAEQAEVGVLSALAAIPGLNIIPAAVWGEQRREREKRQKKMIDFVNTLNRQAGAPTFEYEKPKIGAESFVSDMQNMASQIPQIVGGLVGRTPTIRKPAAPNTQVNLGKPAFGQSSAELLNWSQNLTNPLAQGFNINAGSLGFENGGLLKYEDGGSVLLPESEGIDKIALIDTESGQDTGIRVSGEEMLVISKETLSGLKSALSKGDKKKVFSLMQEQMAEKPNVKGGVEGFAGGGLGTPGDEVGGQSVISVNGVPYIKIVPGGTTGGVAKWYPLADAKEKDNQGVVKVPGQKDLYARTQEINKYGAFSVKTLSEQEGDKLFMSQNPKDETMGATQSQLSQINARRKEKDIKPYQAKIDYYEGLLGNLDEQIAAMDVEEQVKYNKKRAEVAGQLAQAKKDLDMFTKGYGAPTKIPFAPVAGPPVMTEQVTGAAVSAPVATDPATTVTGAAVAAPVAIAPAGSTTTTAAASSTKAPGKKGKKAQETTKLTIEQKLAEAGVPPLKAVPTPWLTEFEASRPKIEMDTNRLPIYESYFPKGRGGKFISGLKGSIGPILETAVDAFRLAEGLRGARATIPTWQPSQAWRDYVSEAGRMANMGLGSQQMANLQQQADRQYITDVANVRGLSGGNVGTLLGNLGRANMQRSQMQSSIAAMDQQARMQNQARFGAILGQDINLSRMMFGDAYTQAMMEKQAGAQLANQALQNMAERIDFEQYYGLGSQQQKMNELQMQAMRDYVDAIRAQKASGMAAVQNNQYRPQSGTAVTGTT